MCLFAVDRYDLTAKAQSILRNVADQINRSKTPVIRIDGYTDDTGDPDHNRELSAKRAQAVRDALRPMIAGNPQWNVAGHGEQDPAASNDTADGRRQNRRVSVTIKTGR